MSDLELKLGGVYRTMDGEIVHIIQHLPKNSHFKFKADNGSFYTSNGKLFTRRKSLKDLTEELNEEPILNNVLSINLEGYSQVQKINIVIPPSHSDILIQVHKGHMSDSYVYRKEIGASNDD